MGEPTSMLLALLMGGLGLIVGSFLGLVSLRLPRGEDIVVSRSRCDGCGRPLKPWRMIPVVSWALSRGKCSDCGAVIPLRYPLIELASGAVGVWAALCFPDPAWALAGAVLGWQLLLIAVIDAEHFWLPDALTLPLFLSGLFAAVALDPANIQSGLKWSLIGPLKTPLIGAAAGFGGLWLLAFLYKRLRGRDGLGGGDPFLLGAIGAWVGWMGLPSVLLWASLTGLSLVAAKLVLRRPVASTDRLPFGVFLAVGAWLTWLYGPLGLGFGA
ncbi:Leader peptidase pppA [Brevundimonas vancanneytii]|uniref:Prepilin leader peptidase/N-methyltransferase n=2 Tax=Brevundimonas vancanneytii TaxID=1325724 RepID=A0A4P1JV90_9CAUL|nr:Leader peptidase pppA [Brevundimonas vancanneytii]